MASLQRRLDRRRRHALHNTSRTRPDLAPVERSRALVEALDGVGEATIMVRFGGQVAVARLRPDLG